ncbi:MAG: nucleoside-diphosphate kinase [Coriobacteriales bacterium]|nr:nucleoside-diphosphate kinase [Coriobacteriales bacterium]
MTGVPWEASSAHRPFIASEQQGERVEQSTYIMVKPDAVARGLVGRIVARFEDAGLKIERMQHGLVTAEEAAANYAEHEGKPFYDGLISYITSGPVVKMVLSGPGAVAVCRKLMGATNPCEAAPGTIRGDYGLVLDANIVHGSDSPESAEREIAIFFGD